MKINPQYPYPALNSVFSKKSSKETRKFHEKLKEATTSEEKYLKFKEEYKSFFDELELLWQQYKTTMPLEEYCEFHLHLRKEFHNGD